jgi:putative tricarboxylic transport membrane protein
MLGDLLLGLGAALSFGNLLVIFLGAMIGLWIGVLPGLGAPAAMAILIPFTFAMSPLAALLLLASISVAGAVGGSVTSILMNIPGEASSAATAYDGYPMAQQGKARVAMGLSVGASFVGGAVGVLLLILLSEPIARVAVAIGPADNFALGILGLTVVAAASSGNTQKALIMGCLGLGVSFVGQDAVLGVTRFAFGSVYLEAGIDFVIVTIGLFAVTEVIFMMRAGGTIARGGELKGRLWDGLLGVVRHPRALFSSIGIGALIGIIPGVGATAANFLSYSIAQRSSRQPATFGKGAPEGVIAPEASNSACIPTSFIPAVTLGIPGGASAAILLVAITIHGIRPGPMLFTSDPTLIYGFFAGLLLSTAMAAALCLVMIPWFALITVIRIEMMVPVLLVISLAGAYAVSRSLTDVFVAIGFGLFGYVARRNGFPLVPLIIGVILGGLIERSFHQALQISGGSYLTFVTNPFCAAVLASCVLMLALPGFKRRFGG